MSAYEELMSALAGTSTNVSALKIAQTIAKQDYDRQLNLIETEGNLPGRQKVLDTYKARLDQINSALDRAS